MIVGRRRRTGVDPGRRPRPRIAIWTTLVIVGAIVIGEVTADVVNSRTPAAELAAKSYAAAVVPIIDESTALEGWLTDVRQHAVRLGRLGLETAIGRLVAGSRGLESQFANLGLPPPDPRSARLLSDVLALRAAAAQELGGGVALAIGPSRDVAGATATLVRAGGELARSDSDYSRFVSSLPGYVRRSVSLPPSRWDTPSAWTTAALTGFAALIGSSPGLLVHQSLMIVAISVQPPALRIVGVPATTTTTAGAAATAGTTTTTTAGSSSSSTTTTTTAAGGSTVPSTTTTTTLQVPPPGSVSCLQPTNRLIVDVVIANAGNVAASNVLVTATLAAPVSPAGRSATGQKHKGTAQQVSPPSCTPGQTTQGAKHGSASVARSGGSAPSKGNGSTASAASRTVRHVVGRLPAGTSDYLTMPSMTVDGGNTYELTVRLGSQSESVTLQVASG